MGTVKMLDGGLYDLLKASDSPVNDYMEHGAFRVLTAAEMLVPVATGELLNSLTVERVEYPTHTAWRVGSIDAAHSTVVEEGDPTNPNYPAQPYLRPSLKWFDRGGVGGRRV